MMPMIWISSSSFCHFALRVCINRFEGDLSLDWRDPRRQLYLPAMSAVVAQRVLMKRAWYRRGIGGRLLWIALFVTQLLSEMLGVEANVLCWLRLLLLLLQLYVLLLLLFLAALFEIELKRVSDGAAQARGWHLSIIESETGVKFPAVMSEP